MKYAFPIMLLAFAMVFQAPLATSAQQTASQAPIIYEPRDLAELAEQHVSALLDTNSDDQIQVNAGNLDPRMGSRLCYQPLDVNLANNAGLERQTTVMLACND